LPNLGPAITSEKGADRRVLPDVPELVPLASPIDQGHLHLDGRITAEVVGEGGEGVIPDLVLET
jgi:hypothetical protein